MIDIKAAAICLMATVAVLSSIFFGMACSGDSEGSDSSAPTPRLVSQAEAPTPEGASTTLHAPTSLPDRATCDEIRGTAYRSHSERQWFLENCITTPAAVPLVQSIPPVAISPVLIPPAGPQAPTFPSIPWPVPALPVLQPHAPEQPLPPFEQVLIDQWTLCSGTWWEGAGIEAGIALASFLGTDPSALQSRLKSNQAFLESNCVTVGAPLALVSGRERLCEQRMSEHALISAAIDAARLNGVGTFSLEFALHQVEGFVHTAGC